MEKEKIIARTQEVLSPFETEQIVKFLKEMSIKTIFDNPLILGILIIVFFFAVIKRSKFVLLFLFTLLTLMALVRYTLPMGAELTATGLLPFAFGCLAIGAVLIYFIFIKVE
jgi:ABC-type protease/lipase transport system fused ATPase/permease subunit